MHELGGLFYKSGNPWINGQNRSAEKKHESGRIWASPTAEGKKMGRWVLSHHGFSPTGGEVGRGGGGALGRMELAWEAKAALGLGACDWRGGLALAAGSWAGDAGPWSFGPCGEEAEALVSLDPDGIPGGKGGGARGQRRGGSGGLPSGRSRGGP